MRLLTCIVVFATLYPFSGCQAQYLSGIARSEFIRGAANGCLRRKGDDPLTSQFPIALYEEYCTCFAEGLADRVPARDLEKDDPAVTAPIIQSEGGRCYEKVKTEALRGR